MSFFSKTLVKKLMEIPKANKLSDDDHHDHVKFIRGTIIGSGYACKEYTRDFLRFQDAYQPKWAKLYARWVENNRKEWACFDVPGKLEFVTTESATIFESLSMPNDWADGTGITKIDDAKEYE
ncbi:hypothetical protein HK097_008887 [Rhizophlyctis rosea]|uniref:Uncharacterized protein n=1 Tax=Rhizophlyctis rosea TaxID=64517 RepID=A0AAD5SIW0_9FUNG|nr:hypothetical protein HK097_008887 [Rhizophlyctis rosea]